MHGKDVGKIASIVSFSRASKPQKVTELRQVVLVRVRKHINIDHSTHQQELGVVLHRLEVVEVEVFSEFPL